MEYQNLITNNLDKILNLWLLADVEQKIVHCSQLVYQHLGYSETELLYQPFHILLPDDDPNREDFLQQLILHSHSGTIVNQKARLKQKNRVIIDIELSVHQLDRNDEIFSLITYENITEVVELRKMVKAKTEGLYTKFNLLDSQSVHSYIRDIVEAALVSVTAGQGLRFNRAFLFLVDEDSQELKGVQAIGPGSGEEAGAIYSKFDHTPKTLTEMIEHYKSLGNTDDAVNNLVQSIRISLSDYNNILIKALYSQKYLLIDEHSTSNDDSNVDWLRETLQVTESIIVPLIWHERSAGVIVADNQVTKSKITDFDVKSITRFADTAINSIEFFKLLSNLDKSITQVKQANIKIRESQAILLQKEKLAVMGELVAHMAHEVRGPLATIGGFASRIFKQLSPAEKHYRSLSNIVETVRTLELVINDILDGSLPEQEVSSGCDCTKAINKVLGLLEEDIHRRKISVNLNIEGQLPNIALKDHHLFEIVNNLVKNALEAMENDGLLLILASSLDNKVVITIQDTGPGLLSENEEKIFSPFFTTKEDGTGLGLVVVKKLVEDNNGTIEVRSIPDKGTTFIVSFPIE
ncbi:MAG: PAS domain S-box protein [Proteobacteria bacterium]|nr:PAS domain S-box protein [Pseudomonadota bacterium]